MQLNLLRVTPAALAPGLASRMNVEDRHCLYRDVELCCEGRRWIYARSVFPDSTVRAHPWLAELGGNGLGEALARVAQVQREPLEYLELEPMHELARARLWARRKLYRLASGPILVQEVLLPALYPS